MPDSTRPSMYGQVTPAEAMECLVDDFEKVLSRFGIRIEPGSDLERICLSATEILIRKQCLKAIPPPPDSRRYYAEVVGLWPFMNKVVRLASHPDFAQLGPHLALLNVGGVPQNVRSPVSDQASDKLFELLFAMVCMQTGSHTCIDDPCRSKGDNPDVLVTIDGRRWGFACKTMYSRSPQTMYDRIVEGVEQIDRSEAEIGCVVINFRNLVDHDRIWPVLSQEGATEGGAITFGCWPDPRACGKELAAIAIRRQADLNECLGATQVLNAFKGRKSVAGYLAYIQTAALVASPTGPTPSSVGSLLLAQFDNLRNHLPVFESLNSALQRLL